MKTWRPSKSASKKFAQNMQNPEFAAEYYERKRTREDKRRSGSRFDYTTAGGNYTPTKIQHDMAIEFCLIQSLTAEQRNACNMVSSAYSTGSSTHHDYIHIVNELIRGNNETK